MDQSTREHFLLLGTNRLVMDAIGFRLRRRGYRVSYFHSVSEILGCLRNRRSASNEVILTDLSLPGFSSLGILTRLRHSFPELPILVLHGPRIHRHMSALEELNIHAVPLRFTQDTLISLLERSNRGTGNPRSTSASGTIEIRTAIQPGTDTRYDENE